MNTGTTSRVSPNMCRFCMGTYASINSMHDIFKIDDPLEISASIATRVMWLTQLQMSIGDGLPSNACSRCIIQVDAALDFINQCLRADKSLRGHSVDDNNVPSEETIIPERCNTNVVSEKRVKLEVIDIDDSFQDCSDSFSYDNSFEDPLSRQQDRFEGQSDSQNQHVSSEVSQLTSSVIPQESSITSSQEISLRVTRNATARQKAFNETFNLQNNQLNSQHDSPFDNESNCHQPETFADHCSNTEPTENIDCIQIDLFTPVVELTHPQTSQIRSQIHETPAPKHKTKAELKHEQPLPPPVPDNWYECEFCGRSFEKKMSLASHLKKHTRTTELKSYRCQQCSQNFPNKVELMVHMVQHTGVKPFQCKLCERGFSRSDSLRKHVRIHTKERPFKCKMCENAYSQKWTLRLHERRHVGFKPHTCSHCDRSFCDLSNLRSHARRIHGVGKGAKSKDA